MSPRPSRQRPLTGAASALFLALLGALALNGATATGASAARPSASGKLTARVARCVERQRLFTGADADSSGLNVDAPVNEGPYLLRSLGKAAPGLSPRRYLSLSGSVKGANPYDAADVDVVLVGLEAGRRRPTEAVLATALSAVIAHGGAWDYEHDYAGDANATLLRTGGLYAEVRGSAAARRAGLSALRHCIGGLRTGVSPKPPALDVPRATACLAGAVPGLVPDLLSDRHGLANWYAKIVFSADESVDVRAWPDGPRAGWKGDLAQGYAYLLSFSSSRGVADVAADINARVRAGAFASYGLDEAATGAVAQGSALLVGFGGDPAPLAGPAGTCGL